MIIRDNFCQFCTKTYVVTSHLNSLEETVQMRGHSIWFKEKKRKNIPSLSLNTPLIYRALVTGETNASTVLEKTRVNMDQLSLQPC